MYIQQMKSWKDRQTLKSLTTCCACCILAVLAEAFPVRMMGVEPMYCNKQCHTMYLILCVYHTIIWNLCTTQSAVDTEQRSKVQLKLLRVIQCTIFVIPVQYLGMRQLQIPDFSIQKFEACSSLSSAAR